MSQLANDIRGVFRRKDDVLTQLLVINVVMFVLLGGLQVFLFLFNVESIDRVEIENFVARQLMLSSDLGTFITHPWTLITYFFTHQQFLHLFFNLLFIFWFGQLIQEYIGANRLLSLYILGGIAGGLAYLISYNTIPAFAGAGRANLLGASGAGYAVVVGAATLLPNYCFSLLFLGSVRIVYIAGAYVLLSFLDISSANPGGNIAHLGGALMGYVFITQLRNGRDLGTPIIFVFQKVRGFFSPKSPLKVTYSKKRSYEAVTSNSAPTQGKEKTGKNKKPASMSHQEEVDAILDKMLVSGYNSLTIEEKRILDAESEGNNR